MPENQGRKKPIKIGVKQGGGPPPGYQWNVVILEHAYEEARAFLDEAQYVHMALQVKELARQDDPTRSDTVDVQPIESYHEIRDKGGILRRLNVRIFLGVHKPSRTIVVLGAIKKESDGQTALADKIHMRRRWRAYDSAS